MDTIVLTSQISEVRESDRLNIVALVLKRGAERGKAADDSIDASILIIILMLNNIYDWIPVHFDNVCNYTSRFHHPQDAFSFTLEVYMLTSKSK